MPRSPETESSSEGLIPPTWIEKTLHRLPGSYLGWALLLAALFGVPGFLLTRYVDTGSADRALSLFPLQPPNIVTYTVANFGLTFYALVGARLMRTRVLAAAPALARLVPEGSTTLRRAFAPVSRPFPPILLGGALLVVSFLAYPDQVQDITGPSYLLLRLIAFPFVYLASGTFVWVYASSIKGLYDLGKGPLMLRSYLEDPHLGARTFGSLSLTLALVYFLGIALIVFSFLRLPLLLIGLLHFLVVPGIILFLLPLFMVHRQMLAERRRARAQLADAYAAADLLSAAKKPGDEGTVGELRTLLALEVLDRKVSAIAEWPLDSITLSGFSAIVLSILAAIATRYVLAYLGG